MKIGICGLGFVGSAMMKSFQNKLIQIKVYDKYKDGGIGCFEDLLTTDIIFLALPTPYVETISGYDLSAIEEAYVKLSDKKYNGLVVIKSTVTPGTTEYFAEKYQIETVHNPEFLTARTAYEDFHNQSHIVLGKASVCSDKNYNLLINFYNEHYNNVTISKCKSVESESMKLFCNSFYATKIQLFNEFYLLCQKNNANYDIVKTMMLNNGWINPMHTNVPGPDGQLSYGGMCFPKDVKALNKHMELQEVPHQVLTAVVIERDEMRENII